MAAQQDDRDGRFRKVSARRLAGFGYFMVAAICAAACGCATDQNLWHELSVAAKPSSEGLQQTQFALIGQVVTHEGKFHVALQRLVLTSMLAPRGQAKLLLFNAKRGLVASYSLLRAYPLWCEGSRIYLGGEGFTYGEIPMDPRVTALDPESALGGNVIDFSHGIHKPFMTREKKYGSSGGIEDDQFEKLKRKYSGRIKPGISHDNVTQHIQTMRELMAEWDPIGLSTADLIDMLGPPSEKGPKVLNYFFDTGFGGIGWNFEIENGTVRQWKEAPF